MAISQLLLPGQEVKSLLQVTLNFLNRLSVLEGPGTTYGLSYGFILLPGMAQESSTPVPSFALGIINSAASLLAQALLNYTASMSSANTSGLMYLRDTFHSSQGCDSAFCLGVGKAGSMTGKTPSLMIQIKQICTPPSSLVKAHQGLGSVDEQSCWLRLLLGHHRYESQPAKMCAGCYKSLPSSLSQSDSQ